MAKQEGKAHHKEVFFLLSSRNACIPKHLQKTEDRRPPEDCWAGSHDLLIA
jgi:hypothetical protein